MELQSLRFFVQPWGHYCSGGETMTNFPERRVVNQDFVWLEYLTANPPEVVRFVQSCIDREHDDETTEDKWIGVGRLRAVLNTNEDCIYVVDVNHFYGRTAVSVAQEIRRIMRQFGGDGDIDKPGLE